MRGSTVHVCYLICLSALLPVYHYITTTQRGYPNSTPYYLENDLCCPPAVCRPICRVSRRGPPRWCCHLFPWSRRQYTRCVQTRRDSGFLSRVRRVRCTRHKRGQHLLSHLRVALSPDDAPATHRRPRCRR